MKVANKRVQPKEKHKAYTSKTHSLDNISYSRLCSVNNISGWFSIVNDN